MSSKTRILWLLGPDSSLSGSMSSKPRNLLLLLLSPDSSLSGSVSSKTMTMWLSWSYWCSLLDHVLPVV